MRGRRWQRASGCALQEDGVQTETLEADTCEPQRAAQEKSHCHGFGHSRSCSSASTRDVCVCPPDLSTVRGS